MELSHRSAVSSFDCVDFLAQGGAVYAELLGAAPTFRVRGSEFDGNEAMCGGAVHLVGVVDALAIFERSVFGGNTAQSGGAVLIRNIFAPSFTRTAFSSNAASLGGGVFLTNDAGIVAKTGQRFDPAAKFEGNVAVEGGAIAMIGGGMPFAHLSSITNHLSKQ